MTDLTDAELRGMEIRHGRDDCPYPALAKDAIRLIAALRSERALTRAAEIAEFRTQGAYMDCVAQKLAAEARAERLADALRLILEATADPVLSDLSARVAISIAARSALSVNSTPAPATCKPPLQVDPRANERWSRAGKISNVPLPATDDDHLMQWVKDAEPALARDIAADFAGMAATARLSVTEIERLMGDPQKRVSLNPDGTVAVKDLTPRPAASGATEGQHEPLIEAARRALYFVEAAECEGAMVFETGNRLRAAIARHDASVENPPAPDPLAAARDRVVEAARDLFQSVGKHETFAAMIALGDAIRALTALKQDPVK